MTDLPLLWEGQGILAFDKPWGVSVVPGRRADRGPSFRERVEAAFGRPVWVVHRLDRDTSGVLLFALDAAAHRAMNAAFEAGTPRKIYRALVAPALREACTVDAALVPARRSRMRLARAGESGKPARTRFVPEETYARAGLVRAEPETGRTHQIRIHLAAAGTPLLVDPQYGRPAPVTAAALGGATDEVVLSRTPLHAARLSVELPGGQRLEVEAPMPADMARALAVLRSSSGQT